MSTEPPIISNFDVGFYDRVEAALERLKEHPIVQTRAPGLTDLLRDVLDDRNRADKDKKADYIGFLRRLLFMYKKAPNDKDNAYQKVLERYSESEQKLIDDFVEKKASLEDTDKKFTPGVSLGVRKEIRDLRAAKQVEIHPNHADHDHTFLEWFKETFDKLNPFHKFANGLSLHIKENRLEASVTVFEDATFDNWGLNINYKPKFTCVPQNVAAIQAIVQYAKKTKMNVRCSGYRHSWAPIFGETGTILISMLPVGKVTNLPDFTAVELVESKPNALEEIEIVQGTPRAAKNRLVRIGCAVTNERLRRWCVNKKQATMPFNVILGETTVGGVNAPICHGAGIRNGTTSELVRKIEYVDANGQLREISDPAHLRAASGAFGLLGVVTYLTLELPPMSYAVMRPVKLPVMRAIPPPPSMNIEDIPHPLRIPHTPEELQRWQEEFESRAENDYYAEWFWFPYLNEVWVNTWNTTDDPTGAKDYPVYGKIVIMWLGGFLMNVAQEATTLAFIGGLVRTYATSTTFISKAAMALFPTTESKTALPNALHFQRAVQNTRVCDFELEMPLQPARGAAAATKKRDFTYVQKAWWDAILIAYKHESTSPQRMPLEMRVMAGSDVILAPQRGNNLGTLSIEVLTLWSERKNWKPYVEEVAKKWMSQTDADGKPLRSRPHWAKEWADIKLDGRDWAEKLKNEDYKEELKEFKSVMADIGKQHGWTLEDARQRFSNKLFDNLLYDKGTQQSKSAKKTEVVKQVNENRPASVSVTAVPAE